ncbi:PREDICTED: cell surface glycoprotein 1-like isoform X4 [Papilio polytes]|uniref:cell surface glycoprotein 1-like isoform X4 n=1 Tax=Papilio polytes TaxID=76194 RepID=UPI00067644D0|nr:PREDICTED: cell surface glycoprotein 1-like isoform X4 [Papilio polytes]
MSNRAWVTLATNDSYGLGALVLAHSLRRAGSAYPAVVLITPSVTDAMRDRLSAVFAEVVVVDVLDSGDAAHLALLQRPELGITFTKIHCWNLTQYEKCVFLDADTLVVQNCDELFEREELSAAPDVGWPDCFNSGVFVYRPSAETFASLITFAQERGSFDGGDQGLLNSYFSDWAHGDINKHLPFLYNVTSAAFYSYLPALKHYGQNLKIIHFIGAAKPWLQQFDWQSRSVDAPDHLRELLQQWWDLFVSQVHPLLDTTMSGVAGNLARVSPGDIGAQREALDELTRRQGWEAGNIDYMGADSFANIWAKISQTLSQPPALPPKEPTPPPVAAEAEATEVPQPAVSPAPAVEEPKTEIPVESEQSKEDLLDAVKPSKVEEPVAAVPPTEESAQLKSSETVPLATPEPSSEPPVETSPEESALPALPVSEDPKPSSLVTETISEEAKPSPQEAEPTSQSVEHSPQEAEPSPVEAVETPIAKETAPTTEALPEAASSEESTIAVETADIPVEPSVPETPEIPVPVVEAVLAEKETPAEEAVKIDEIPAPVIEASATEIPKSEAEPVAAVAPPQEQKTEEKVEDVITKVSEDAPAEATPVETPAATPETPVTATEATTPAATEAVPPKPADIPLTGATDSPPLANTPSKEDVTAEAAAKSEARRKPAGKLRLHPPAVADPLPTPDSELEDADTLAQSIIASELRTPTVTSPTPALRSPVSPPPPKQEKRLSADESQLPTPPVGSVSLSQIGVKPAKDKPTTAAQIESSLADKPAPTSPTSPTLPTSPTEAKAPAEAPKKKVVKKVVKKESAASGDAPVPPPRKKEKKPKEK